MARWRAPANGRPCPAREGARVVHVVINAAGQIVEASRPYVAALAEAAGPRINELAELHHKAPQIRRRLKRLRARERAAARQGG